MRIFNNTNCDDVNFLIELYRHLITLRHKSETIESITFNENSFTVFGHDDSYVKTYSYKSFKIKGKIRWFDKNSGIGYIRINNTLQSVPFYACNVKKANSLYPELVTNVEFNENQDVRATVSNDCYIFNSIGLTNVEVV